jgi:hypothetical protein
MKHVKLFEDFSSGKILLGILINDGGYGAFPGIIDGKDLKEIKQKCGDDAYWETYEELNKVPEALLVMFDDYDGWTLEAISKDLANQIYNVGGKEEYFQEDDGKNSQEELEKAFFLATGESFPNPNPGKYISICVIQNPEMNTIYWSDNPDDSHGYWEEPNPISVDQAIVKLRGDDDPMM